MKTARILPILTLVLFGCSTAQLNTAQAIADPIIIAAASAYAQTYGVPPVLTAAVATPVLNDIWGAAAQVAAKQPAAQGAATPAVGAAIQTQLAGVPQATQTALLTAAANKLTAYIATGPTAATAAAIPTP